MSTTAAENPRGTFPTRSYKSLKTIQSLMSPTLQQGFVATKQPRVSNKAYKSRCIFEKKMFEEIQGPFEKHKPPERKNFLSYSYCIYKFCQLLGQNHVLKHLSLIKNREKLHMQDKLFEKICKDLGWEFIPSL